MTMSNDTRARVKGVFEPIALAMGRAGLTPDGLTLIGFGITVAGAALLAAGLWLVGGLVVFVGGVFDMFDGTLARATGKVSKLGAFMDSVFDRWGEAAVYVGIVAGLIGNPDGHTTLLGAMAVISAFAMGSAFMVSYTRAKSEGLGFTKGTGMAEVGVMPREVRLIVLSLGLVLGGILGIGYPAGSGSDAAPLAGTIVLGLALAVIALLATITVIQRIVVVRRQAAAIRSVDGAAVVGPPSKETR
jgi:CDP-diacylglycerol--glycerol-3-phosphate 3-phosphatidyltransferase